jgi:PleD family two-component response regulator
MAAQIEILVIGTNEPILATVLRLLNNQESWHATGCTSIEEALQECNQEKYKILLIGAGLTVDEEEELKRRVKEINPALKVIPHYGGGSGLLFAEIHLALAGGTTNQAQ